MATDVLLRKTDTAAPSQLQPSTRKSTRPAAAAKRQAHHSSSDSDIPLIHLVSKAASTNDPSLSHLQLPLKSARSTAAAKAVAKDKGSKAAAVTKKTKTTVTEDLAGPAKASKKTAGIAHAAKSTKVSPLHGSQVIIVLLPCCLWLCYFPIRVSLQRSAKHYHFVSTSAFYFTSNR